jgi:hypothetical protein
MINFGLQCDAKPLKGYRIGGFVKSHPCNASAQILFRATGVRRRKAHHQGHELPGGARFIRSSIHLEGSILLIVVQTGNAESPLKSLSLDE